MEQELINLELLQPQFWTATAVAFLCGALIGLERQYRGKAAGMRTGILISIGTMIFVYMGSHIEGGSVDSSRVLGQVVTGIGFLGAGVMFNQNGTVNGVTTASVIWVLAAIGSMAGLGYIFTPLIITLLTIAVLSSCTALEKRFAWLRHGEHSQQE
ncbi:MAG: MgtC/SapB family protein [Mariprofundaceae bacterium]|nr:MgtC/SapB family protein [Mariprofundaceae bacterium]